MKNLSFILCLLVSTIIWAQKPTIAVLNIDTEGLKIQPEEMGNMVRLNVQKLDKYEVLDKYDAEYLIKKNQLDIKDCYGKICLQEVGEKLGVDKVLSGSVETHTNDKIVFTLKVIDIDSNIVELQHVKEFLYLTNEIGTMANMTLNELMGIENDPLLEKELTSKGSLSSENNTQSYDNKIRANGVRMGFSVITGDNASILSAPKSEGGFDATPVMFQFGYQFEKQYLNEGRLQALFEVVPLVTGLEQGLITPSLTIMNGIRDNKTGFEFSFGPSFTLTEIGQGYYDTNGQWVLDENNASTERLDSRSGRYKVKPSFVFAFGKTFTSGNLNIPINGFFIPEKDSFRFGVSFGYNSVTR